MKLIIILTLLVMLYAQFKIKFSKNKDLKRLLVNNFSSVKKGESLLHFGLMALISAIIITYIYLVVKPPLTLYTDFLLIKTILIMLFAFIAFVQLMFVISFILAVVFSFNSKEIIKYIDIHAVDTERFLATGYIYTLMIAIFETYIYFVAVYELVLRNLTDINLSVVVTALVYGLIKTLLRKKKKKKIALFVLGVSLALAGLIVSQLCGLIYGIVFMYICTIFIAFKDMKTGLKAGK